MVLVNNGKGTMRVRNKWVGWDEGDIPSHRSGPVATPNLTLVKLKGILQQFFKLCDIDGDGDVTPAECELLDRQVAEVMDEQLGRVTDPTTDATDHRANWKAMDSDGDGSVSMQEYVLAQVSAVPRDSYEETYKQLVKAKAGVEELRRRKRCLHTRLEQIFRNAFRLADADGDRSLSLREVLALDEQLCAVLQGVQPRDANSGGQGGRPVPLASLLHWIATHFPSDFFWHVI
jgi:hypothetical protein